jgi:hypothetical protein
MKKTAAYEEPESEEESSSESVEESFSGEEDSGVDEQQQNESDDEESASDNSEQKQTSRGMGSSLSSEQCTFDLRNLVAVNSHQIDATSLYSSKKKTSNDADITIPWQVPGIQVDEDQLLAKAQDGCAQLISALWQLPTESSDAGPLVTLPYFEIKIPRALVSVSSGALCLVV